MTTLPIKKTLTRRLKNGAVVTDVINNVIIMRGTYTLSGGSVAVTYPQEIVENVDIVVLCQSDTANHQYPTSITVTGFTANGTGSDTGNYIVLGTAN